LDSEVPTPARSFRKLPGVSGPEVASKRSEFSFSNPAQFHLLIWLGRLPFAVPTSTGGWSYLRERPPKHPNGYAQLPLEMRPLTLFLVDARIALEASLYSLGKGPSGGEWRETF
jgi:hypothetical protein